MYLKQLTNEEFNKFADKFQDKSPYQSVPYTISMNNQNYESFLVGLMDGDHIMAASSILIRTEEKYKYAYAPRGFLIDYTNFELLEIFTKEIKKFLNKNGVIAIKVNPMVYKNIYNYKYEVDSTNYDYNAIFHKLKSLGYHHLGYNNFFEALKPRFEAVLDLNLETVDLFKNIKKEFRTKIRGAERNGIIIYKGRLEDLEHLYNQKKDTYPRNLKYFQDIYTNFGSSAEFYYAKVNTSTYLNRTQQTFLEVEKNNAKLANDILKAAGKGNAKLLNRKLYSDRQVEKYRNQLIKSTGLLRDLPDGIILATALVIKHGKTAYLFMDSFDKDYRNFNAKHLLIWKLIEKYSSEGLDKFNLGGISNGLDKKHKYTGLNEFKLNFGPRVVEYIGDYELITNKASYILYHNAAPLKTIIKK